MLLSSRVVRGSGLPRMHWVDILTLIAGEGSYCDCNPPDVTPSGVKLK